jgi:hypothetical protein
MFRAPLREQTPEEFPHEKCGATWFFHNSGKNRCVSSGVCHKHTSLPGFSPFFTKAFTPGRSQAGIFPSAYSSTPDGAALSGGSVIVVSSRHSEFRSGCAKSYLLSVTPAKAGAGLWAMDMLKESLVPACAGMTDCGGLHPAKCSTTTSITAARTSSRSSSDVSIMIASSAMVVGAVLRDASRSSRAITSASTLSYST